MQSISAQEFNFDMDQMKREFEQFKKSAVKEYSDFRDKANSEYADFLRAAWKECGIEEPVTPPTPDPPVAPVCPPREKGKPIAPKPMPYKKITPLAPPPVPPTPKPIAPIKEPEVPYSIPMPISYFGAKCDVRLVPGVGDIKLNGVSENDVADAWKELSDGRFDLMLTDCLKYRESLKLCDWGYYTLTKMVAETFCEAKSTNTTKLLQAYLMTQAGYQVRLARANDKIYLMLPSESTIYSAKFCKFDGVKYYFLDEDFKGGGFFISPAKFPGEQGFSIRMTNHPQLPETEGMTRTLSSKRYPEAKVTVEVNKNLINFYDNYPRTTWDIFSHSSLCNSTKEAMYPTLKKVIEGKSQLEAANILINFVQTGFEYKVDDEQFGYERSFFGDETIFYDYSDCEDRAILFSILVRDLLGLDVALLYYPGHLATAVKFDEKVEGDYLKVGDNLYTVCDPTYIGASCGETMTGMDNNQAEVYLLQ